MKEVSNSATSAKGVKNTVLTGKMAEKPSTKELPAVLIVKPVEQEKTQEEQKGEEKALPGMRAQPGMAVQPTTQVQTTEQPKRLTIDEIDDKADRLYLLRTKRQEIKEKRKQLEKFTISHDQSNAQLTLVDAKGLSITTSNPQSIGKLLIDWMADLDGHLIGVEENMRKELKAYN